MPTTEPPADEPSFDGYRVVAKIRSGPITDLYRAEQVELGRLVFIKALGRSLLPSSPFAASLEREARLLTDLDHPGILRVIDFVKRDRAMWLVLEHVDGPSLDELLAKKGKLDPRAAVAIALRLAEALQHAHARGVVHRDLSPRNVIVSKTGAVKLTNFVAAAAERLPTAPELLEGTTGFGTPAYMSPEQLLGEPEDARSDLFSLGIVLYEMLTGRRPYETPDDRIQSQRTRHDAAPAPSRLVPDLSGSLDRTVRRCLAKLPSDRYASAVELGRALTHELEASGVTAEEALLRELSRLGIVTGSSARPSAAARAPLIRRRPVSVARAFAVYALALSLVVLGGAAIQRTSTLRRGDRPRNGAGRLELLPPRAAYLRVVVDPWANVVVDGEQVDTTPFARAIPLTPGVHYVRLEHPRAPVERRTVTLEPGETVLLDVKMDLPHPKAARPEGPARVNLTDPSTP